MRRNFVKASKALAIRPAACWASAVWLLSRVQRATMRSIMPRPATVSALRSALSINRRVRRFSLAAVSRALRDSRSFSNANTNNNPALTTAAQPSQGCMTNSSAIKRGVHGASKNATTPLPPRNACTCCTSRTLAARLACVACALSVRSCAMTRGETTSSRLRPTPSNTRVRIISSAIIDNIRAKVIPVSTTRVSSLRLDRTRS